MNDVQLYLGDCFKFFDTIEDNSIDVIITDPPFGINFSEATWEDDPNRYEDLMIKLVSECNRIIKDDGPVFIFQAMLHASNWHKWFPPGFRVFSSCKGMTQYRPVPIQYSVDPCIFWGTPKTKKRKDLYPRDYFIQNKAMYGKNRPKRVHPTQRDLELMAYIVEILSVPDMTIFDPFMGSGSTGIACVNTNRNFIGIEINEEYFSIAEKRIQAAIDEIYPENILIGD